MTFKSRTEAYSYTIWTLSVLLPHFHKPSFINALTNMIDYLKISLENHDFQLATVITKLQVLVNLHFPEKYKIILKALIDVLTGSRIEQTIDEKFANPLARRLESELGIYLLQHPTQAMLTAVCRVSQELLALIDSLGTADFNKYYLSYFAPHTNAIAFGCLDLPPTIDELKQLLTCNAPDKLTEIMYLHFKFAQKITRKVPITHASCRTPVGRFADYVKEVWPGEVNHFFTLGLSQLSADGHRYRCLISDEKLYTSELYIAKGNRGRQLGKDNFAKHYTQQMGLMLDDQQSLSVALPYHGSKWKADCKCQQANLQSSYVLDLIEHEAVYVSGPSGMTSLFLGQMEILANFETETLKKHYLTAIMSYLVAGGFHSIHEIIGPAHYGLDLVPGYQVIVPQDGTLAPPPNYHQFYRQQMQLDPEFALRRNQAWLNYLHFFECYYLPSALAEREPAIKQLTESVINLVSSLITAKPHKSLHFFHHFFDRVLHVEGFDKKDVLLV